MLAVLAVLAVSAVLAASIGATHGTALLAATVARMVLSCKVHGLA